jgi:adenylate cyclase
MERKLTAILCADVAGYSRLMGQDEAATLATLTTSRKIIDSLIEQHRGRFVNSAGDSVLAEFASVVNAVECATHIQTQINEENASLQAERQMHFRIGVNLGDVIVEGEQIYGDGVNVAARLESLAEPGGICISQTVHDHIRNKLTLNYIDLGPQQVKNIADPVRVFRVLADGATATPVAQTARRWKIVRRGELSLAGIAMIVAAIVLVQHLSLRPPAPSASVPPPAKPALALPDKPSIAVLPFTNLSGDPKQDYFSDGIANELIESLSGLPNLFVIARNSSFAYKGKALSEQQIGRELGVRYVLEGNVRQAANEVRVGVELVDASAGSEVWAQRFDRPLTDIFAIQDEIVGRVVTTLGLVLKLKNLSVPREIYSGRTNNLEAFDDYLRGFEYYSSLLKADSERARQWFERAIEHDPKFADAYAYLGWTYFMRAVFAWDQNSQTEMQQAERLTQKALELDNRNSPALALRTELDLHQGLTERAVADGKREVALNPNSYNGYAALSDALESDGQSEEAIRAAEKGMRLDPGLHAWYALFVGRPYVDMGRYDEAIPLLKEHCIVFPDEGVCHFLLAMAYTGLGRNEDAEVEVAEVRRVSPGFNCRSATLVVKDAAARHRGEEICHQLGFK